MSGGMPWREKIEAWLLTPGVSPQAARIVRAALANVDEEHGQAAPGSPACDCDNRWPCYVSEAHYQALWEAIQAEERFP